MLNKKPTKRKAQKRRRWALAAAAVAASLLVAVLATLFLVFTSQGRSLGSHIPGFDHFAYTVRSYVRSMSIVRYVRSRESERPTIPEASAYGIDVSRYQDDVDWEEVRAIEFIPITRRQTEDRKLRQDSEPIHFVFVKATEGTKYVDPNIEINRAGVRSNGMIYGAYHVLTMGDSRQQAENYIRNSGVGKGDMVPVIDIEESILGSRPLKSVREKLDEVSAILSTHYRVRPIIYCGYKYSETLLTDKQRQQPLWLARYTNLGRPEGADIWQFTDRGTVEGIDTDVDINALYAERFKLKDYILRK